VQDELGQAVDPIQAAEDINRRASDAAGPGYRQAYAQPMVLTPEIESIMRTPAFQEALPQAVRNIRNAQRNPTELGFRLHPDGSIEGANTLSVEGFDQVIRAMRDSASAAMDTSGFRPRNTTNSVHIDNRRRDLQRLIGEQNEPYRDVVANYADEMAIRDALGNGQDVAKLTGPEIAGQMRDMPQHAQEAWMTGARTALADGAVQFGQKHENANVAQRVRQGLGLSGAGSYAAPGDVAKLQAIEATSGRPGVLNRLDDRLEAEDRGFKTFAETFGNSKSYGRQAYDEAIYGGDAKVAAKFLTGRVIDGTMDLLFRGRGAGRFKQAVQERVAEVLTTANPADVTEAMAAIQRRAETDRAFNASLQRAGIKLGQITALQAAGMPTEEDPVSPAAIPGYR